METRPSAKESSPPLQPPRGLSEWPVWFAYSAVLHEYYDGTRAGSSPDPREVLWQVRQLCVLMSRARVLAVVRARIPCRCLSEG